MTVTHEKSEFVYAIYIRTTPEKLWTVLTTPDLAQQYWFGIRPEAEWKEGGAWKRNTRLSIRWRHELRSELREEGWSLCTTEIEPVTRETVKLAVTHSIERENSKLIAAVSVGWPQTLSNLKSLLETGSTILPMRSA